MWFGLLTPGAHPSRPGAPPEATVMCWTPHDRRKIDGPMPAVHGGLRVLRRQFYDQGWEPSPPRCFVCREEWLLPDPRDLGTVTDDGQDGLPAEADDPTIVSLKAGPRSSALLACVHLDPLRGPGDTPLDEEVIVAVPGTPLAILIPLLAVPRMLELLTQAVPDDPAAECGRCGAVLPGGAEQRRVDEALHARAAAARRPRRGHGRRAA